MLPHFLFCVVEFATSSKPQCGGEAFTIKHTTRSRHSLLDISLHVPSYNCYLWQLRLNGGGVRIAHLVGHSAFALIFCHTLTLCCHQRIDHHSESVHCTCRHLIPSPLLCFLLPPSFYFASGATRYGNSPWVIKNQAYMNTAEFTARDGSWIVCTRVWIVSHRV